jgi:hypothetical protein
MQPRSRDGDHFLLQINLRRLAHTKIGAIHHKDQTLGALLLPAHVRLCQLLVLARRILLI